jgi:peptide chain release factor 1
MDSLEQRFADIARRQTELEAQLSDPELVRDQRRYTEVTRTHRELGEILEAFAKRATAQQRLSEVREMLADSDPDMAELAQSELAEAEAAEAQAEVDLTNLLLPRDPNDAKNTILEIRAGTGGDEAGLFAGDLLRMYTRYTELRGWRIELLSASESDLGGFKEVIFQVTGEGAYARLKYEGGTHRVQRVPATEAQGRIHTSAVTIAVMPEAEEVDIEIKQEELRVDVFRSGGPGGQSVNTTDSAVRITHLPTGLVVSCQDEKSQLKNKNKAMKVLRSRLLDQARSQQDAAMAAQRKAQVGSGDRSERIRTYNFPQNRLTDHRINLTLYSLDRIMEGSLDDVIQPLVEHARAIMLRGE